MIFGQQELAGRMTDEVGLIAACWFDRTASHEEKDHRTWNLWRARRPIVAKDEELFTRHEGLFAIDFALGRRVSDCRGPK